jgi:hypothetical protein
MSKLKGRIWRVAVLGASSRGSVHVINGSVSLIVLKSRYYLNCDIIPEPYFNKKQLFL